MSEIKLTVRPFEMGTEKEAALKPLEEASEAYSAWQEIDGCGSPEQCRNCDLPNPCESIFALADEIADTIQASCNLAARYGIDLQAAMERCERRNRGRGRYEDEDAKPCRIHDGNDCNCGGDCANASAGMGVLREKSPEEMSAAELIEALYLANGYRGNGDGYCEDGSCTKTLGVDWCGTYHTCRNCRKYLLDLLNTAHEREVTSLEYEKSFYKEKIEAYDDDVRRRITDLTHERDGLLRRLEELSDAGITSLHRLLRETVGEAKNITDNARVYIDKQQGGKDEHCGSRGSIGRNHGGGCGAQCAGEHILSAEPTAQEVSEREKVLERLRGYDVYMTEPPSENANRLLACITGKKDARIACKDDVESVRDKLIELLSTPGWNYCETCELVKINNGE